MVHTKLVNSVLTESYDNQVELPKLLLYTTLERLLVGYLVSFGWQLRCLRRFIGLIQLKTSVCH